jgi:hypothetical protein
MRKTYILDFFVFIQSYFSLNSDLHCQIQMRIIASLTHVVLMHPRWILEQTIIYIYMHIV